METPTVPSTFAVFGATGDLSRRKLLPALFHNHSSGHLDPRMRVLGISRTEMDDDAFRNMASESLAEAGVSPANAASFLARLHYQPAGDGSPIAFAAIADRLKALETTLDAEPNYSFYLSLPPRIFPQTLAGLGGAGLSDATKGFRRVVIEKPFGKDLASARALNATVHEHFSEDQIYRIDHYLGKETVQNLLVFRLANAFIESSWNRDRIDAVQITVGESLGVGSRAGYYDHAGAVRDMLQNHITQLVTLVAMEVPASFAADAIRYEKLKVIRSIAPIRPAAVVRGRYSAGEIRGETVPGYLEEEAVPAGSTTETFVALELAVDTWRWQGVPFYVRTGKRMPAKTTQIAIRFRGSPVRYFEKLGCQQDTSDVLTITLQPNEGFAFHFDIKAPGEPMCLERVPLRFDYSDHFRGPIPGAYETLLLDVLSGDQTLFVHGEEVEESWRVFDPLLQAPPPVFDYPAGTWGPAEASHLAIPETELWQFVGD